MDGEIAIIGGEDIEKSGKAKEIIFMMKWGILEFKGNEKVNS